MMKNHKVDEHHGKVTLLKKRRKVQGYHQPNQIRHCRPVFLFLPGLLLRVMRKSCILLKQLFNKNNIEISYNPAGVQMVLEIGFFVG